MTQAAPKNKADEAADTQTGTAQVGRRIGHNSVYLVIRTVLIMIVSLYTSRLALQLLGETDFGIYSVVASFVIFFGFLNSSMERSVTRYLLYEKGKGTPESLRRMFNVAMIAQLCIVGVVLILGETIGLWYVNHRLNVPADKMVATNWVYQLSLLTLCANIIKVPYNAMIVAYEKMSFYAFFAMGEVILRLVCILALLLLHDHLLIIYAVQFLAVTVVVVATYRIYCTHAKIFGRVCRFSWLWNRQWFMELLSFCGWSILGTFASLGALQGLSLILNYFFGVNINAAFGLAAMMQSAVFAILVSFQTAFSPKLVALYARKQLAELRTFIYKLGRYSFYLGFGLAVPLCMNMDAILNIWLGNDVPDFTSLFCLLCIVSNAVDCLAAPGLVCNQATGRVKVFNIVWSVMLISNLPLSWVCIYITGWPPVAFAVRVFMTTMIYFFITWIMHRQIGLNTFKYIYESMLRPMLLLLPALAFSYWIHVLLGSGFWQGVVNSLCFWLVFAAMILSFGLNSDERAALVAKFNTFLHKYQRTQE